MQRDLIKSLITSLLPKDNVQYSLQGSPQYDYQFSSLLSPPILILIFTLQQHPVVGIEYILSLKSMGCLSFPSANSGLSVFAHPLRISSGITSPASPPQWLSPSFHPSSHWVSYSPFCWYKIMCLQPLLHSSHGIMIICSCACFLQYVSIFSQHIVCIYSTEQSS